MGRYTDVEGDFKYNICTSEWHGFGKWYKGLELRKLRGDIAKFHIIVAIDSFHISTFHCPVACSTGRFQLLLVNFNADCTEGRNMSKDYGYLTWICKQNKLGKLLKWWPEYWIFVNFTIIISTLRNKGQIERVRTYMFSRTYTINILKMKKENREELRWDEGLMGRYTDVEGYFKYNICTSEWYWFGKWYKGLGLQKLRGDIAKFHIIVAIDHNPIS